MHLQRSAVAAQGLASHGVNPLPAAYIARVGGLFKATRGLSWAWSRVELS